jgi:hypothetical protein
LVNTVHRVPGSEAGARSRGGLAARAAVPEPAAFVAALTSSLREPIDDIYFVLYISCH